MDQPLYYIDDASRAIALTIDDGPDQRVYTPQVLRVLHRYGVTATFSMIGREVAGWPRLARAVAEEGHHIANHTWTDSDLVRMQAHRLHTELAWTSHAIHSAAGVHPQLFRAPYGAWSAAVLRQCERMKMVPVDWSVNPRDWSRPGVRTIVRDIMHNTRPGSIILEHDGGGTTQTVEALRIVLPRLLREGYHFHPVTASGRRPWLLRPRVACLRPGGHPLEQLGVVVGGLGLRADRSSIIAASSPTRIRQAPERTPSRMTVAAWAA